MDVFVSIFTSNWHLTSTEQIRRLVKLKFQEYMDVWQVGIKNKGAVFGLNMYQALADSKITFNCHIDAAKNNAANIRLFEATGSGTCLITDWKENLNDLFDIDKEVVTYKTIDECVEKVNYLLAHDKERNAIAVAGQKRTLNEHSLEKRINKFADYMLDYL